MQNRLKILGIGKKTAERMVLELRRDKLAHSRGDLYPSHPRIESNRRRRPVCPGQSRLAAAAEKALASLVKNGVGKGEKAGSFDALFREALAGLSK